MLVVIRRGCWKCLIRLSIPVCVWLMVHFFWIIELTRISREPSFLPSSSSSCSHVFFCGSQVKNFDRKSSKNPSSCPSGHQSASLAWFPWRAAWCCCCCSCVTLPDAPIWRQVNDNSLSGPRSNHFTPLLDCVFASTTTTDCCFGNLLGLNSRCSVSLCLCVSTRNV